MFLPCKCGFWVSSPDFSFSVKSTQSHQARVVVSALQDTCQHTYGRGKTPDVLIYCKLQEILTPSNRVLDSATYVDSSFYSC
jgi:hypothetical protein